jgi:uncharacterized protein (DUF1499 family)
LKLFVIFIIGCMMFFSCAGQPPVNLGIHNNQLTDCPAKPNCINSQAIDENHTTIPFMYQGKKETAFKHLKKAIESFKRITIIVEKDNYLHIEFKSAIMGFIDDVEFYFPEEKVIHVRSASRLGYSDFGVNQKRVEQLRERFVAELTNAQE